MTERITPEQATLTPEIIAEIRSLDAQRDPECRWLMQTAEIRWRLERLAANCIIPALDEIERLQGDLDYLIGVLEGIRDATYPESAPYKAIGALVALTLRAGTDAPPPAREEGVTP